MNILIATSSFGKYDSQPLDLLKEEGFTYSLNPYGRKVTQREFLSLVGESVGIIAGTETIDADVLRKIPSVKVISRCGVGMDNVDMETAKQLNITVTNTPDSVTTAVAELTVGLLLSLLRKTFIMDRQLKSGQWSKIMGHLLSGKKAGIIGFGRIGQRTGQLISSFGVQIGYFDLIKKKSTFATFMDLEKLCSWADILCLHVSKVKTQGVILDKKQIECMKDGSWLINCSRGGVVNEEALFHALKTGKLSGAAVDVFEEEPYKGPLRELDNVILTPHVGSYAKEARIRMEIESVKNLIQSLRSTK